MLNVNSISICIEVIPPLFESNSNFIGINFSVGNTTATGWRLVYQINEIKPQPLLGPNHLIRYPYTAPFKEQLFLDKVPL